MRQINLKTEGAPKKKKKKVSLSLVIGSLLLVITGLSLGGLFLYKMQLENNIGLIKDKIDEMEKGVDEQKFQEVYDLQGRIMDIKRYSLEANNKIGVLSIISENTFDSTLYRRVNIKQVSPLSSSVEADILVDNADQLADQLTAYKQAAQIENIKMESSELEEEGLLVSIFFNVKDDSEK